MAISVYRVSQPVFYSAIQKYCGRWWSTQQQQQLYHLLLGFTDLFAFSSKLVVSWHIWWHMNLASHIWIYIYYHCGAIKLRNLSYCRPFVQSNWLLSSLTFMVVIWLSTSGVTSACGNASTRQTLWWAEAIVSAPTISLSDMVNVIVHIKEPAALDSNSIRGGPWSDVKGCACPWMCNTFCLVLLTHLVLF